MTTLLNGEAYETAHNILFGTPFHVYVGLV